MTAAVAARTEELFGPTTDPPVPPADPPKPEKLIESLQVKFLFNFKSNE